MEAQLGTAERQSVCFACVKPWVHPQHHTRKRGIKIVFCFLHPSVSPSLLPSSPSSNPGFVLKLYIFGKHSITEL